MSQATICVVGSLNADLVTRTPRLPQPGETVSGGPFATYPGGKGANQAVAAARLGATVAMIGRVGDDAFGHMLRSGLQGEGVDVAMVDTVPDVATGTALIAVEASGENTIILAPGANAEFDPADVEAASETIAAASILLLQLEVPLATVKRAAEIARAHGTTVVLNPAPAQPLPDELLALVDYLVPNEHEAALLLGDTALPEPEDRAAELYHKSGGATVIVTLGSKGVVCFDGQTAHSLPPYPATAVDSTAAGDAFIGGFAAALSEGRPLREALQWGSAAGAIAVAQHGAQASLPQRDAILELLDNTGN